MSDRRFRVCSTMFVASVALSLSLVIGTARATVNTPEIRTTAPENMASCAQLPLSRREFCKSQVAAAQVHTSQIAIDTSATAKTASQMAECKKLPLSDRGMCAAQAGYGQAVPARAALSATQLSAFKSEETRFHAAAAACARMPVSDRNMCMSQAGEDVKLATAR